MPAAAVRRAFPPDIAPQPQAAPDRAHLQVAEDSSTAAPSPARALQARLQQDLQAQAQTAETRWPLYIALPFWGGVSALLWAAIIGGGWMVLRHI